MEDIVVRIESVEISNFKNVKYGKIKLNIEDNKSSMLGLYGQNGSGKSALIDALGILKIAMNGEVSPQSIKDLINIGAESSTFKYVFRITTKDDEVRYFVSYQFTLLRGEILSIRDEILSYVKEQDGIKSKPIKLIHTNKKKFFDEDSKIRSYLEEHEEVRSIVHKAKECHKTSNTSFIFSKLTVDFAKDYLKVDKALEFILILNHFSRYKLFTIDANNESYMSNKSFPIYYSKNGKGKNAQVEKIQVKLDEINEVDKKQYEFIKKLNDKMNTVLKYIMPGLKVSIEEVESKSNLVSFQMFALREKQKTPLYYESEGIKKIVAWLQLLILAYNNSSVTVAIDEIDSGIFEFLLGELLHVFENGGRGQLFFTAHNLRPLETINKDNIMFTTTNESNRYTRLKNVNNINNLRLVYYREILLGNLNGEMYNSSSEQEIAFALREAGDIES